MSGYAGNGRGGAPRVSIVVVAYRAREDVLACLDSIDKLVKIPHEVVVVDDGSGDGTAEAVASRFPGARLIAKPVNEGLSAGRNSALDVVNGDFVLMLDADTVVLPEAVERMATALEANPAIGLIGPKLLETDGELQLSCRRFPPFAMPFLRRGPYPLIDPDPPLHRWHLMKDFDHESRREVVWVSGAAQMWRRSLVQRIGRYDERLSSYGGEDTDWCLRVWDAGLEVHYVPDAEVIHAWQHVVRKNRYSRAALRALRDWYYLQWKHRRLRRDPRLDHANA